MSIKSDIKTNISGIEDIYLTKNPEISFFKKNYKRYSNFATEITLGSPQKVLSCFFN